MLEMFVVHIAYTKLSSPSGLSTEGFFACGKMIPSFHSMLVVLLAITI